MFTDTDKSHCVPLPLATEQETLTAEQETARARVNGVGGTPREAGAEVGRRGAFKC